MSRPQAAGSQPMRHPVPRQQSARSTMRGIVVLFAALYAVEGLCALSGLTRQPFDQFGKDGAGWSATRLASTHALLALPWAVKPIYGALSDNLPLFGSRRRSYLVVAITAAALACFALANLNLVSLAPGPALPQGGVVACLFLLSLGMAVASAVAGGVLVESGQRFGNANLLVTQQWLWYGLANLAARLGGGALAGHLGPGDGLRAAALALVLPLLCVVGLSWRLTPEPPRGQVAVKPVGVMLGEMGALVRSRQLLIVAGFLFCFTYNPGLQTPLYFHLTGELHFGQDFIGTLGAAAAAGSIVGVLLCRALAKRLGLRTMFYICVALGVAATLANFALVDRSVDHSLALAVYFASGVSAVFALVMAGTLAATVCPGGQEGLCYAAMMSIENAASISSDASGSYLFDHLFHGRLGPLIVVSAAFTAVSAILIRLLPERATGAQA